MAWQLATLCLALMFVDKFFKYFLVNQSHTLESPLLWCFLQVQHTDTWYTHVTFTYTHAHTHRSHAHSGAHTHHSLQRFSDIFFLDKVISHIPFHLHTNWLTQLQRFYFTILLASSICLNWSSSSQFRHKGAQTSDPMLRNKGPVVSVPDPLTSVPNSQSSHSTQFCSRVHIDSKMYFGAETSC